MSPSKEELQELIHLCSVNRFVKPENIDINDLESCVTELFTSLMVVRKQAFKNEFTKLSAYNWMVERNKTAYDLAMNILFEDDYNPKPYINKAMKKHRRMFKKKAYKKNVINRLRSNLVQLGFRAQRKEQLLGHLAKCFMEFLHSSNELREPGEFKKDISQAIEALERSKKCYQKLEKYKDLMYGYAPFNDLEYIDSKLTMLKRLEDKYIFPAKKTNKQYPVRIFIIYILRYFISEHTRLKDNEILRIDFKDSFELKYVLAFIDVLLGFDCFEPSQTPNNVNVRKIINDELDRRHLCLSLKREAWLSSMVGQSIFCYADGQLVKIVENFQDKEDLILPT